MPGAVYTGIKLKLTKNESSLLNSILLDSSQQSQFLMWSHGKINCPPLWYIFLTQSGCHWPCNNRQIPLNGIKYMWKKSLECLLNWLQLAYTNKQAAITRLTIYFPEQTVFYRKKNNNALWGHFCNADLWENMKNAYRKYLYWYAAAGGDLLFEIEDNPSQLI